MHKSRITKTLRAPREFPFDPRHRFRRDRVPLDQRDERLQFMLFDRGPIVLANFDVDANHASSAHQLAEASGKHQRPAMRRFPFPE
jgi:hypothetical protein